MATYQKDVPGNRYVANIGTTAAVASGGANAVLGQTYFVAPGNIKVLDVKKVATAAEVTAATSITSASYRRFNLLNGGTSGTGTTIMASLNNTASSAAGGVKSFATTTNNTATAGAILYVSHLTVGAASADATSTAESVFQLEYQLL
jgi:hypothetical protein